MKHRSPASILRDLNRAGINADAARRIALGSGLSSTKARQFIIDQDLLDFEITVAQQLALFEIVYDFYVKEAKRLCTLKRTEDQYGKCDWDKLNPHIKNVIVDMRYRGDYTNESKRFLQSAIVANDMELFIHQIKQTHLWLKAKLNIPKDRQYRRITFLTAP